VSGWWVQNLYQAGQIAELISWAFWVLLSITLHELAHGWAALRQGDDTPRRLNRMTANPVVHMGTMSLLMFALLGIAWGVMPVSPSRFRDRRKGEILVAAAGPGMNIALAAASLTILIGWLALGPQGTSGYRNIAVFLWVGGWLNLLLAIFNLLPIPPLDGSTILAGLSRRIYHLYQQPRSQMIGMFLVLAIFITGCGSFIFGACATVAIIVVDTAGALLGNPSLVDVIYG
jgi:Zn-dependent protease